MRHIHWVSGMLGSAAALLSLTVVPTQAVAADTQICDQFGSAQVAGGHYIVQNNEWGDTIPQCVTAFDTGFSVDSGQHNIPAGGAPAAYPSIYAGCHYGNCSTGNGLPLQVSAFHDVHSIVDYTVTDGEWDAAYDIWLDTAPNPSGQNNGAEIMIWGNHAGPPQPVGAQVGTADLAGATWDVWEGSLTNGGISWNVVSYVRRQTTTSLDVHVQDFTADAAGRGYVQPSWYLTSVQFGFEPWIGGPGMRVNSFSLDAG
jgi:glycosyl hydrolase family 12